MDFRILILFLGSISAISAEENYIGEIKFSFREEKIPAVLTYLLNNSLEILDIRSEDIIHLSKLDKYDLTQINEVLNYFNTSNGKIFTVDNFENVLKSLDIKFDEFYRNWINVTGTGNNISNILQDFGISTGDFFVTYANNIEGIYDVLRTGIYDSGHVTAALKNAGKTADEIYNASRDLILQYVVPLPSSQLMMILKNNGWNKQTATKVFTGLNITTVDIYNVEKFRNIFKNVTDYLNRNLSIAVFVGPNQVALHKLLYDRINDIIDGVTIKAEVLGLEVNIHDVQQVGSNIIVLSTKQNTTDYINITSSYNATGNCSYVSIIDGQLKVEPVEVQDSQVEKNSTTQFQVGSPVICEGYLYGLAKSEDSGSINFDQFYTTDNKPNGNDEDDNEDDEGNNPSSGNTRILIPYFLFILIAHLFLSYSGL